MNNYKEAPLWLINEVKKYAESNGGYLYAPLPHPDFKNIPVRRGFGRSEIIKPFLHGLSKDALDIGMHLGNECHLLEDSGFRVTGIEFNPTFVTIAKEVRELCSKKFIIYEGNFFDYPIKKFDTVFALNIFHHFIKNEELFIQLDSYLESLHVKNIFFQPSNPNENQMQNSFKFFSQNEFANYIKKKLRLNNVNLIGDENGRNIYLIN